MRIACPLCGQQSEQGTAICPSCGHDLAAFHFSVCPVCGALSAADQRRCHRCLSDLTKPLDAESEPSVPGTAHDAAAIDSASGDLAAASEITADVPVSTEEPEAVEDTSTAVPTAMQAGAPWPKRLVTDLPALLDGTLPAPLGGIGSPLALARAMTQPHRADLLLPKSPSDAERFDAELFGQIAVEPPSLVEGARRVSPQPGVRLPRIVTILVALFVLAAAIVPLFVNGIEASWIQPRASVLALVEAIDALPSEARVLVVWGYDAAYAGEMDPLAENLLDDLAGSGAHTDIVALSPTSLGQAQQILSHSAAPGSTSLLGYVPISDAGWRLLAEGPAAALPGSEVDALPAALQDYALVLILADGAATARGWAEQVEPSTGVAPFVLVTARSEAALLPYRQTGQFRGLLGAAWAAPEYASARGLSEATLFRAGGQVALALAVVLLSALAALLGPGRRAEERRP